MRPWAVLLVFAAAAALQAQVVLGSLLYADPVGRGIRLVVVDRGAPDRMTLRVEEGDENRLRKVVLALAGRERVEPVQVLQETAPPAWQVQGRSGGALIRAGEVTYWRFLPGQILPVRFTFDGRMWTLRSAELPARRFD